MKFKIILTILAISTMLILAGCGGDGYSKESKQEFAECISDKGAIMFGAYWCSHCEAQKKSFGDAFDDINYVECSLPGGRAQTEACIQADIQSYPTWEFAPGDRLTGELSFEQLSAKTGCELPVKE